MDTLLGFQISGWDYLTFLAIFIIGVAFFALPFSFWACRAELLLPAIILTQTRSMSWDGSASWPSYRGFRHLFGHLNQQLSSTSVTCPRTNGAKPKR